MHKETFAANLYTLLDDSFYLQTTIGEFANNKLQSVIDRIKPSNAIEQEYPYLCINEYDELSCIIGKIGDEFLRSKLSEMLSRCNCMDKRSIELNRLRTQRAKIDMQITELEESGGDEL